MTTRVGVSWVLLMLGCSPHPSGAFERSGDLLVNPYGFEIAAPPSTFVDNPELGAKFAPQMTCQVWQNSGTNGALLALCSSDRRLHSRADLVLVADGIRDGMVRQVATIPGASSKVTRFAEPVVHWDGTRGDLVVTGRFADMPVRSRVISTRDGIAYVLAISLGESTSSTDTIVESLRERGD